MLIAITAVVALLPNLVDIRDFGAIGDGKTKCTSFIQAAIDSASRVDHAVVEIPAGQYLTGTLHLKTGTTLHLEKGATLLGSPLRHDYDHGVWYSLLMAADVDNISVIGEGTIDGQGDKVAEDVLRLVKLGEIKIPPKGWRPSEVDRPEVIEFTRCKNIRVEGVTLKNSACWVQTYRNCQNLTIHKERVDSKTYWNNDGIDIVDCQKVEVSDCDIDSNDDGICLKSVGPKDLCQDIDIRNCRVRSSASAIKFGTSSGGGFHRIHVRDIRVRDTFRSAIALESVDGGSLQDVLVEDVVATHTGNAFFIRLGHRNTKVPVGSVRNVTIRNLDVQVPAGRPDMGYPFHGPQFLEPHNLEPSSIVGHRESSIKNVLIENVTIRHAGGGGPNIAYRPKNRLDLVPERPTDYPEFTMFGELPSWGLYIRHAENVRFRNVKLLLDSQDYRPAIVSDHVNGLSIHELQVVGPATHPVVVARSTHRVKVDRGIRLDWVH